MPVGSWFSNEGGGGGGSSRGTSLTGSGPATQPRAPSTTTGTTIAPGPAPIGGQQAPGSSYLDTTYPQRPTRSMVDVGAIGSSTYKPANYASNQLAQQAVGGTPDVRSLYDTYYGPQSAILGDTLARQREALGLVNTEADYREGLLRRDTDLSRRGLALDRQALGVDANLTKTQQANLDRLRGILGKQLGLEGETFANTLARLGIDEAKLKDMAKRQTFDLRSNLTSRGAFSTVANQRGTGRIERDLGYGLAGINNQRGAADIAHRGNLLGLQEKGIGYDNQGAGLAARLANNGIDLARIGLSEEGLANSLSDGIHAIGLDQYVSVNGLLDAIGSTNAQQSQLALTIYGELEKAAAAGLLPGITAEQLAALREAIMGPQQTTPGAAPRAGTPPI